MSDNQAIMAEIITDEKKRLNEIMEANTLADQRAYEYECAKNAASAAKKRYEASVADLQKIIRLGGQSDGPSLFEPAAAAVDVEDDGDDWRDVSLSSLGIADAIVKALGNAGLGTVGELQAYLEPNEEGYCKRLTDITGIGDSKREQIEAALDQFWFSRGAQREPLE